MYKYKMSFGRQVYELSSEFIASEYGLSVADFAGLLLDFGLASFVYDWGVCFAASPAVFDRIFGEVCAEPLGLREQPETLTPLPLSLFALPSGA